MKVALLGLDKDFNPNSGRGPAVYIYNLYKNLSQIRDLNIVRFETKIPNLLGGGNSFTGNAFTFTLDNLIRNFEPFDLIHTLYFNLIFSPFKYKKPIITTVHDAREIVGIPSQKTNDELIIYKKLVHYIGTRTLKSNYIICVSTQTKEEMVKLGYPKNRIYVVNLGIDRNFLTYKPVTKSADYCKFNVGYVGSFAKNKNVSFIIDTAKILNNSVNFYLWGGNQNYSELLKSASELKTVKFMGFAPGSKLINIYDSFKFSIIWAMCSGLSASKQYFLTSFGIFPYL